MQNSFKPVMRFSGIVLKLWMLVFLISSSQETMAQEWNYARLVLIHGGNIPFNFNSLKKYSEGIEIENGTILGVTLADSTQPGRNLTGFDLNVQAFNGATEITGDANSLDLNTIRIKAESFQGFGPGFTSPGYIDLPPGFALLCSYTDPDAVFDDLVWSVHQLAISYQCGMPVAAGGNGSLLGEQPDYYVVEIELELVPTGGGF
ncbi:MAG: hypothetical protein V2B15_13220 [Bacteroidota bacterium]